MVVGFKARLVEMGFGFDGASQMQRLFRDGLLSGHAALGYSERVRNFNAGDLRFDVEGDGLKRFRKAGAGQADERARGARPVCERSRLLRRRLGQARKRR